MLRIALKAEVLALQQRRTELFRYRRSVRLQGALELVVSQLQRGNAAPHLRFRCWKHIIIELAALLDDDAEVSANGAHGRRPSYTASQLNAAPVSKVRDDILKIYSCQGL